MYRRSLTSALKAYPHLSTNLHSDQFNAHLSNNMECTFRADVYSFCIQPNNLQRWFESNIASWHMKGVDWITIEQRMNIVIVRLINS